MKVRKEFILEAHKAACSDLKNKIEQEFPDLFPKPEYVVGEWYVHTISGAVIQYLGESLGRGFDPLKGMGWAEKNIYSFKNNKNWELFTDIEKLKELFIDEAERRGLKHGNFECLFSTTDQEKNTHIKYDLLATDSFWIYNNECYNGVWAVPFGTITKAEAEKQLGKKII